MVLFFSLVSIALYLITAFMLLRSVRSGSGVAAKVHVIALVASNALPHRVL